MAIYAKSIFSRIFERKNPVWHHKAKTHDPYLRTVHTVRMEVYTTSINTSDYITVRVRMMDWKVRDQKCSNIAIMSKCNEFHHTVTKTVASLQQYNITVLR